LQAVYQPKSTVVNVNQGLIWGRPVLIWVEDWPEPESPRRNLTTDGHG
jgi:hypothetical protein